MCKEVLVPSRAVTLVVMLILLWAPARLQGQNPPRAEAAEAARKTAPHTADSAMAYWKAEIARRLAENSGKVYDPRKPAMSTPPRTPWGAPDLRGYYLTAMYTPLERPDKVAKAMYTPEEAVEAFTFATTSDAGVDTATVLYDW